MTTSTHINRISAGIAVALAAAATATSVATAAGEPKNELPFTRGVASRALTQTLDAAHLSRNQSIQGETKNQAPFTLHLATMRSGLMIAGEPKNQAPFTGP